MRDANFSTINPGYVVLSYSICPPTRVAMVHVWVHCFMPSLMFAIHFQTFSLSSSWSCEWSTWSIQVANFWQPIRNTYCYGRGIICGYGADVIYVYVYVYSPGEHIIDVLGEESSHHRVHHRAFPSGEASVTCSQQHHQQLIVWESLSLGISTHYDAIGTFNAPPPHAPQPPGTHLPLSHVPQILSTRN